MSRWKVTTLTEFGNFVAWCETEESAQQFAEYQQRKGGWDCRIEEVTEND